jgi:hypothetical protein
VSPSRRRDVLPLVEPKPPAEHPIEALNSGKARRSRSRRGRAPGPETDPRDEAMLMVIRHVQGVNGRLDELGERLQLALIEAQVLRRRIERLEARVLEAVQEPPGATDATKPDRSDVEASAGP